MLNIKRFRRVQTITSVAIFIAVFFFCWYVTKFKILDIQLSYWGVENKINWIWNTCLVILSISMAFNTFNYIEEHPRAQFKKTTQKLFILVCFSLFMTGIINMKHEIHNITAFFYFFAYPMAIFAFAHLNRKLLKYREWLIHVSVSVSMVVLSLVFIKMFHGMAVTEIIHGSIVMGWNLWILTDD